MLWVPAVACQGKLFFGTGSKHGHTRTKIRNASGPKPVQAVSYLWQTVGHTVFELPLTISEQTKIERNKIMLTGISL